MKLYFYLESVKLTKIYMAKFSELAKKIKKINPTSKLVFVKINAEKLKNLRRSKYSLLNTFKWVVIYIDEIEKFIDFNLFFKQYEKIAKEMKNMSNLITFLIIEPDVLLPKELPCYEFAANFIK